MKAILFLTLCLLAGPAWADDIRITPNTGPMGFDDPPPFLIQTSPPVSVPFPPSLALLLGGGALALYLRRRS